MSWSGANCDPRKTPTSMSVPRSRSTRGGVSQDAPGDVVAERAVQLGTAVAEEGVPDPVPIDLLQVDLCLEDVRTLAGGRHRQLLAHRADDAAGAEEPALTLGPLQAALVRGDDEQAVLDGRGAQLAGPRVGPVRAPGGYRYEHD